jgi:hypothetical protein
LKPVFKVGYRGEVEYDVGGVRYSTQARAWDGGYYQPGVYEREVAPKVGCLFRTHNPSEFPPPEVCALFPGWVPCRWNPEARRIEYQGGPPAVRHDDVWGGLIAEVAHRELESLFAPTKEQHR